MTPTDIAKKHVIDTYVTPARLRGEKTIHVRVGSVVKELGWTNRTPSVFSTLSSRAFQREAGVELIEKRGGPASGGPSTTVQFIFRVLEDAPQTRRSPESGKRIQNGAGLEKLYGIFKDVYADFGGGETYLKTEREWGPDVWERYEFEKQSGEGSR